MKSDISDDLVMLIRKYAGERCRIDSDTRIFEDLRLDGDDAFELLDDFRKRFNVNMTGFNMSEYFAPEGIDLIGAVITLFKKNKTPLKTLTVKHLEHVAVNGKWIEQEF